MRQIPEQRMGRPGRALTLAAWLAVLGTLPVGTANAEPADRAWPKMRTMTPLSSAVKERATPERAPRFVAGSISNVVPDGLEAYAHLGLGAGPAEPKALIVDDPLSGDLGPGGMDWRLRGDNLTLRMAPGSAGVQFNSKLDVSDRRLTVGVAMPF
ncbi:hypothetical protein [Indioceanicola profundi]|uniref:hypothetical protein n=1 Tax=Indioceanicola profundi TaxID=2220096 RepID=UPI000E6A980C|nr:hypothetical protein [Indioceanicola profundi]